MLTFALIIAGLTLLVIGVRGVVALIGDRGKGRSWPPSVWAGVIGWFAMLGLFLLILVNLYLYPTAGGQ